MARSKTTKFLPPRANASAEGFTFVSPRQVYSNPQPPMLITSQPNIQKPSQNQETVLEGQEMTRLQIHESQGSENQEMESGQGSVTIEGTTEQPDVETQSESISINPSIGPEGTAHLGGADPRTCQTF